MPVRSPSSYKNDELVYLIDTMARRIALAHAIPDKVSDNEMKRFSCFTAAIGNQPNFQLSDKVWLNQIDSLRYFSWLGLKVPNSGYLVRERYKIAFLMLVHQNSDLHNIYTQLKVISTPNTIVLLHIDPKFPDLLQAATRLLKHNQKFLHDVRICSHPLGVEWGSSSMVFGQLLGFFNLLDAADWDYVIPISAKDYPLRSPEFMHEYLEKNPGRIWARYWDGE